MDNVEYVVAGYLATGAMLAAYRWRLARRTVRARRLVSALSARPRTTGRARR